MGSHERFLSVYIEHTAGKFPVWNAPEQIMINNRQPRKPNLDFAENVRAARKLGLRAVIDNSNESVGKKSAPQRWPKCRTRWC